MVPIYRIKLKCKGNILSNISYHNDKPLADSAKNIIFLKYYLKEQKETKLLYQGVPKIPNGKKLLIRSKL